MVNPYALNTRQTSKVQLGQSNALKKFEKLQAKHTQSVEKRVNSSNKKKQSFSLDSSKDDNLSDENDDDDDDEDSVFKNIKKSANKFMKAKKTDHDQDDESRPKASQSNETDSNQSDLEISILDHSTTPNKKSSLQGSSKQRPSSRLLSAASSVSSFHQTLPKRSPSRVKFSKQDLVQSDDDNEDESTIIDDLLSKNLLLDIDDLEAATATSISNSPNKFIKKQSHKHSKSPLSKRSESVASIIEDKDEYSSLTPSLASPSILEANLIFDINELEKDKSEKSSKKKTKKDKKEKDKKKSKKSKKRSKTPTSQIETETDYRTADSSIVTEIETEKKSYFINKIESDDDDDVRTNRSELESRSYNYNTNKTNRSSLAHQKSYNDDDFETDQDLTSRAETPRRKQLSFADKKTRSVKSLSTTSVEVQVDPNDLLKHSDLIKSVATYNPSSLVLATVSYLNDSSTLRDLNQLTGYNLINQTFNDLIKMNVNFMKNFLSTQRNLYEQQIQSIQPRD